VNSAVQHFQQQQPKALQAQGHGPKLQSSSVMSHEKQHQSQPQDYLKSGCNWLQQITTSSQTSSAFHASSSHMYSHPFKVLQPHTLPEESGSQQSSGPTVSTTNSSEVQ
jgi:hypothetical protein